MSLRSPNETPTRTASVESATSFFSLRSFIRTDGDATHEASTHPLINLPIRNVSSSTAARLTTSVVLGGTRSSTNRYVSSSVHTAGRRSEVESDASINTACESSLSVPSKSRLGLVQTPAPSMQATPTPREHVSTFTMGGSLQRLELRAPDFRFGQDVVAQSPPIESPLTEDVEPLSTPPPAFVCEECEQLSSRHDEIASKCDSLCTQLHEKTNEIAVKEKLVRSMEVDAAEAQATFEKQLSDVRIQSEADQCLILQLRGDKVELEDLMAKKSEALESLRLENETAQREADDLRNQNSLLSSEMVSLRSSLPTIEPEVRAKPHEELELTEHLGEYPTGDEFQRDGEEFRVALISAKPLSQLIEARRAACGVSAIPLHVAEMRTQVSALQSAINTRENVDANANVESNESLTFLDAIKYDIRSRMLSERQERLEPRMISW